MPAPVLLLGLVKKRAALRLIGAAGSALVLCCVMGFCGSIALLAFASQGSTAACTVAAVGPGAAVSIPVPGQAPTTLSESQSKVAKVYIAVGRAKGVPDDGIVIALMMGFQESGLQMLANVSVPESLNFPHDGVGSDHNSVGSAQQRPSAGWGAWKSSCSRPTTPKPFMVGLRDPTLGRRVGSWMCRDGSRWTRAQLRKRFRDLRFRSSMQSGSPKLKQSSLGSGFDCAGCLQS
ncbi:hypothetical protein NHF46_11790 [Arthrobacter alpinus]|nr:hypothetical protein [Arthrobacter alpinus]